MGEMSELFLGFDAGEMFMQDLNAALSGKPFPSEDLENPKYLPDLPKNTDLYASTDTAELNKYKLPNKKDIKNMSNIFEEFDSRFDTTELEMDIKEAAENGGRREVPHDTYEVEIYKLELTASKSKGDPMVTCWMKIVEGDYKGSLIFMNQVVTQGFQIHIVNQFLRDLIREVDNPPEIVFKTFKQYSNLIMDIAEIINGNYEYAVRYYDNKGYNAFTIEDVYILED